MGFGLFKKIKDRIKDAGKWIHNKVIKPVLKPENIKKAIDLGTKIAPLIATGVASSQGAPPQAGYAIGKSIQGLGKSLGFG